MLSFTWSSLNLFESHFSHFSWSLITRVCSPFPPSYHSTTIRRVQLIGVSSTSFKTVFIFFKFTFPQCRLNKEVYNPIIFVSLEPVYYIYPYVASVEMNEMFWDSHFLQNISEWRDISSCDAFSSVTFP